MAKLYDILLLAIAALILAGAAAFYATTPQPEVTPVGEIRLTGGNYEAVPVPELQTSITVWDAPPPPAEADEGWEYGVFTPPKVYIVDGILQPVPPKPPEPPPPPFGIELVDIDRGLYRLQYDGYLEVDADNLDASIILLENVETDEPIRTKVGRTSEQHDFELLDFEIRVSGIADRTELVTLRDTRTGDTVTLSSEEPLFSDERTFTFASTLSDEEVSFTFRGDAELGQTWEMNDAKYTLLEISLDKRTATVRKESAQLEEPQERTLGEVAMTTPQREDPDLEEEPETTEPEPSRNRNTSDDSLESLFDAL